MKHSPKTLAKSLAPLMAQMRTEGLTIDMTALHKVQELVMKCPYCQAEAKLVMGEAVYPHRPDLYIKKFYHCEPCGAYVGTHAESGKPLGTMANAKLRALRMDAHEAFDPLWQSGRLTRKEAYRHLALFLGIEERTCHIGSFDTTMAQAVIDSTAELCCTPKSDLQDLVNKYTKKGKS